jgi:5-methyltetrahydrofolate--homocysteine methyltransferase
MTEMNWITELTHRNNSVAIHRGGPTVIIGERINPTGRKVVLQALQEGNFKMVRQDAVAQVEAGATVLDVNAGVPSANEPPLLSQVVQEVMSVVDVPLCIDTSNPAALEEALKLYDGKALINSVNGEENSLKSVLPLAKEYGAALIGLCMDEHGIPATPEERVVVAGKIIERAAKFDIPVDDIVIDPLAMTIGADNKAGWNTLETTKLVVKESGVNITMGASNVSFGLPDRKYVNSTFIAMAIQAGLTCPITNLLVTEISTAILAAVLSLGKDEFGMRWIKAFRKRQKWSLVVVMSTLLTTSRIKA